LSNIEGRFETLSTPLAGVSHLRRVFAPKVGIRALREPSPRNSPRFAEPNRRYYYNGKIIRTLRVA